MTINSSDFVLLFRFSSVKVMYSGLEGHTVRTKVKMIN